MKHIFYLTNLLTISVTLFGVLSMGSTLAGSITYSETFQDGDVLTADKLTNTLNEIKAAVNDNYSASSGPWDRTWDSENNLNLTLPINTTETTVYTVPTGMSADISIDLANIIATSTPTITIKRGATPQGTVYMYEILDSAAVVIGYYGGTSLSDIGEGESIYMSLDQGYGVANLQIELMTEWQRMVQYKTFNTTLYSYSPPWEPNYTVPPGLKARISVYCTADASGAGLGFELRGTDDLLYGVSNGSGSSSIYDVIMPEGVGPRIIVTNSTCLGDYQVYIYPFFPLKTE